MFLGGGGTPGTCNDSLSAVYECECVYSGVCVFVYVWANLWFEVQG